MMKKIFDNELLNMGNGISPFNAWLLIRGLRTLPIRLERITKTTVQSGGIPEAASPGRGSDLSHSIAHFRNMTWPGNK